MNTFEDLKAKAADMELAAANFLNADGESAAQLADVTQVEFRFVDGVVLMLPRAETERPEFDQLEFKLQPSQAH